MKTESTRFWYMHHWAMNYLLLQYLLNTCSCWAFRILNILTYGWLTRCVPCSWFLKNGPSRHLLVLEVCQCLNEELERVPAVSAMARIILLKKPAWPDEHDINLTCRKRSLCLPSPPRPPASWFPLGWRSNTLSRRSVSERMKYGCLVLPWMYFF